MADINALYLVYSCIIIKSRACRKYCCCTWTKYVQKMSDSSAQQQRRPSSMIDEGMQGKILQLSNLCWLCTWPWDTNPHQDPAVGGVWQIYSSSCPLEQRARDMKDRERNLKSWLSWGLTARHKEFLPLSTKLAQTTAHNICLRFAEKFHFWSGMGSRTQSKTQQQSPFAFLVQQLFTQFKTPEIKCIAAQLVNTCMYLFPEGLQSETESLHS